MAFTICAKTGFIFTGWWCNNHLETYESQWEGCSDINILWKNKTCSKPPTRIGCIKIIFIIDGIRKPAVHDLHLIF